MRINDSKIFSVDITFRGEFNKHIGTLYIKLEDVENMMPDDGSFIINQALINESERINLESSIKHHREQVVKLKERLSEVSKDIY